MPKLKERHDHHCSSGARQVHASKYDDWTVYELKTRVKELGLNGYFDKSRAELIDMLRERQEAA